MINRLTIVIIPAVLLFGCLSNSPRKWFGDNVVGANLDTARQSTEAIVNQDKAAVELQRMESNNDEIYDAASKISKNSTTVDQIIKSEAPQIDQLTSPHTKEINAAAANIKDTCLSQQDAISDINEIVEDNQILLEHINLQAQGKKFHSRTKIVMIWIMGIAIVLMMLGIAIRTLPGFVAINRAINGIGNAVMDVISGQYKAIRQANLLHLDRTATVDNSELPQSVQDEISKTQN